MKCVDRRTFLGAAGAGLLVLPGRSGRAAASERVRIAVIGLRNRGTDHAQMFAANPGAEVVAVCDVDDAMFAKPVKAVEAKGGKAPRIEKDFRRLLDDKSIDAVTIATPDHWHALMTVMACQAGKDVYVEKPVSHNVVEGRRMVEAARKYKRVVQAGTQKRSTPFAEEGDRTGPRRGRRQGGHGPGLDPSEARQHRPRPARTGSRRRRLRDVARPRARPAVLRQPVPLQLALVLELGDRRAGQQRHPRASTSPAGAWASRRRSPSAPAGASTSSTTTRRSPTPRPSPGSSRPPA